MIWSITRKEIRNNLLSFKFYITFVLVIVLFLAAGFLFIGNYQTKLSDYSRNRNKSLEKYHESCKKLANLAIDKHLFYTRPKSIGFVSDGKEGSLPNLFYVKAVGQESLPINKGRFNLFLPDFAHLNWLYLIGIVLSFVVLVISYDAITGEKEKGTLGLMLSNSVSRHSILLSKYLGILFTVLIPFIVGILLNLIVVISSQVVSLQSSDWIRILVVFIISLIYLSFFAFIGLFISSRTSSSVVSLVLSLLIWVFFVIIVPNSASIFSKQVYQVPKRSEVKKRADAAWWSTWQSYPREAWSYWGDPFDPRLKLRTEARNASDKAYSEVIKDYERKLINQVSVAKNIAKISPLFVYESTAWSILDVGFSRFLKLIRQIKRYEENLLRFIKERDAEDEKSMHFLCDEWWVRESFSQQSIDPNLIPMFEEKPASLGEGIRGALWDIVILILFNIAFFVGAYVSFLRYDVR